MGSTGDDIKNSVGNFTDGFKKDPLGQIVNVLTNVSTAGYAGYDVDNKKFSITSGYLGHAADETVGEVSGRNVQREGLAAADARATAAAAAAAAEQDAERQKAAQADINASNSAAAARINARGGGGSGGGARPASGALLGGSSDQDQDFLGF